MSMLDLTIDELLTTTRAVRKRLDLGRPVERAVIKECLELAMQAPTGSNHQRWRWIVLDDSKTIGQASEIYGAAMAQYSADIAAGREQYQRQTVRADQMSESVAYLRDSMHRVPALLIPVLADRFGVLRSNQAQTFHHASQWGSIIPAVWSFMLALRSRGLGSAWTTIHLFREQEMADLLGIPYDTHIQAGLFPVAYTIGTDFRPASRHPADEVTAYNRWNPDWNQQ